MKFVHVLLSIGASALVGGCSSTGRTVASVNDVGVIGPDGRVLLYYKDGDRVVVKECPQYTVLFTASTPVNRRVVEARKNCPGPENRIPIDVFKAELRRKVAPMWNGLAPLTDEEAGLLHQTRRTPEEMAQITKDAETILAFVTEFGGANGGAERLADLQNAIKRHGMQADAMNKLDAELERTYDLIVNDSATTLAKYDADHGKLLFEALERFNPKFQFPCGLSGSLEERSDDCAKSGARSTDGWSLVTRTAELASVWRQPDSSALWAETVEGGNLDQVSERCDAFSPIPGLKFHLASKPELSSAMDSKIFTAIPTDYEIWTSTRSSHAYDRNGDDLNDREREKVLRKRLPIAYDYWYLNANRSGFGDGYRGAFWRSRGAFCVSGP